MRPRAFVVAAASALLFATSATAQDYQQLRNWCYGDATDDQTIQGCSAVIGSNKEPRDEVAMALYNRGLSYSNKGQTDRALQDYDQAIRLKPDYADAYNNRCWVRAKLGQLQPALIDCNEALRIRPNDAQTLDSRGFVFLKLGQFDAAIADYSAALKLNTRQAESLFGRGLARRKKGDKAAGDADIAAARAIKPDIDKQMAGYGVRLD